MNFIGDTIAAICTGPGGALAIIRVSGPEALTALDGVFFHAGAPLDETPRVMRFGHALSQNGETCLAVYMPAPHSYTGDHVVEIHCHGGNFAPDRLLRAIFTKHRNIRMAEPGEFTRRAFLNGKMDLTQAEAVADLISANSEAAVCLAERQLSGVLGARIRQAAAPMLDVLSEVESRMDFPEEELDWRSPEALNALLAPAARMVKDLLATAGEGNVVRNGVRLCIAGVPNVGKSSLMNRILGYDRAIVTNLPGTTRDTLEENAIIRGIQFRLTDTAGIRASTQDNIEKIGIRRSLDSAQAAEIVLWMVDPQQDISAQLEQLEQLEQGAGAGVIVFVNKADLHLPVPDFPLGKVKVVLGSVLTGEGIETLFDALADMVKSNLNERESDCAVAQRHFILLQDADAEFAPLMQKISEEEWDLAAAHIRKIIAALNTVTGDDVSPDVLDEIFSRFCIGK